MDLFRVIRPHPETSEPSAMELFRLEETDVVVRYVRHPSARRYRLTILKDVSIRCTVPVRGSMAEARRFVERCQDWLATQVMKMKAQAAENRPWSWGMEIWYRGRREVLTQPATPGEFKLGTDVLRLPAEGTVEAQLQAALRSFAARILPEVALRLAEHHGYQPGRITVRNQRSRWGSCSRRGTISLNWRLIQCPDFVRDYIVLHELAHLRHMNHSERFWNEVARVCPEHAAAEAWLRQHSRAILR